MQLKFPSYKKIIEIYAVSVKNMKAIIALKPNDVYVL